MKTLSSLLGRPQLSLACCALAFASLLGGCGPSGNKALLPKLPADTNLLLITLDTTRADRIGSYGHAAAQTPNLDRLATAGVRFERAYAHVPLTLPTHASLLTGTLPPEHGIHDNGRRALSPELTSMAQVFQHKGYRTGAFVSAIALDGSFGLNRGFEVYDDQLASGAAPGVRVIDRPGDQTTDRALAWLDSGTGPFFMWVHYYDPHAPYLPPTGFGAGDAYDGEIAFMDSQVGRLLGALDSAGLRERTLVVAIADHGESLQEKGEHTHAALIYDGTQRIPFLMQLPGVLPAGKVVDNLAGQSDLFPTLMELYDWSVPDQSSGSSLVPAIAGLTVAPNSIWIESEYAALNFGWSSLHGIVQGPWKYVAAPTPELYHLLKDPGERNNLADSEPAKREQLQAALEGLQASMGSFTSAGIELGADMARDLASLGYAQGASSATGNSDSKRVNPVEHIEILEQYHMAIGLGNQGRYGEMLAPLETVQRAFPDAPGFRTQLGDAYRRVGRLLEAREQLEGALKLDDSYDPAHFYLGELSWVERKLPAAMESYRRTLELRPDYVPAKERLAGLLAETGEDAASLLLFKELAKLQPPQAKHWLAIADLEHRLSQEAPRIQALERALALDPLDLGAINMLAWALATSPTQAVRDGQRALELAAGNVQASQGTHPEPLLTHAAAQAELGQWEAAAATIAKAIELAEAQHPADFVAHLRRQAVEIAGQRALRD
mgnify:CR=1 FL=1